MNGTQSLIRAFSLTAGECNAQNRLPLTLLTERLIEVATYHADELGIGFSLLSTHGLAWVLSRLTLEMTSYPTIDTDYAVATWIETLNPRFSERNFQIIDCRGEAIGYAHTTWMAIKVNEGRHGADLATLLHDGFPTDPTRKCPIEPMRRIPAVTEGCETFNITYRYCDLDFNRHVNTVRHIEKLLNTHDLDWYDHHEPGRFEINFRREGFFGHGAEIRRCPDPADAASEIYDVMMDGYRTINARIAWRSTDNS